MPITKVKKDSVEYFELKAKYESGIYTNNDLAKEYDLSPMHLYRFIKNGNWQKGITKEIYDAKKITAKQEILDNFKSDIEKKAIQSINKKIVNEVKKSVEAEMSAKTKEEQAKEKALDILLNLLDEVSKELLNGNDKDASVEEFEYNGEGKLSKKKIASKSSKYAVIKSLGLVELLKGTGALTNTPSINLNNNALNINAQQNINENQKTVYVSSDAIKEAEQHIKNITEKTINNNNDDKS